MLVGAIKGWIYGMIWGAIFGVLLGLFAGGLFSVRHFVLRLMLWKNRLAPLRYVCFLDYVARCLLLRQVGGGYIFADRMVMEYLASPYTIRARSSEVSESKLE